MGDRRSLAEDLADDIVNDILSGTYPPHASLPSETELALRAKVSRLTVREAIKALAAKSVVRVEHGRGTYVNPSDRWSMLDPVLLMARSSQGEDRVTLPHKLIEARRVVEVAVAELAAKRRSALDLQLMETSLADMRTAAAADNIDSFVAADLAFHQQLLNAADNTFLTLMFDPLSRILQLTRQQTKAHAPVRAHAIEHHQRILDAVRRRTPTTAGRMMREHMEQTQQDMDIYVLDLGAAMLDIRAGDGRVSGPTPPR